MTLCVVFFPSLELSVTAGIVIVLVAFAVSTRSITQNWVALPRALRLTHIGLGVIVAGTLVRIVESVLADGALAVPSWADALAIPGLVAITASLFLAAHARAATSRISDVVDALSVSTLAITTIAAIGWSYLTDGSVPWEERAVNGGALALDFVFLTMLALLIYGPGGRSEAARWLGIAGAGSVLFDTAFFVGTALDAPWRDEPTRILPLAFVCYAIATTDENYGAFASPGTRPQQYRWALYPVALIGSGVLAFLTGYWFVSITFITIVVLAAIRLMTAGMTAQRLTFVVEAQAGLAEELSRADTASAAIAAAHQACARLLDDRPIVFNVADAGADRPSDEVSKTTSSRLIRSSRERVSIDAGADLPPYLVVALTQVANVLEPAIAAIEDRSQRLHLEAEVQAEQTWQAMSQDSLEVALLAREGRIIRAGPNAQRNFGFNPLRRAVSEIATLAHANVDTEHSFADPYRDGHWVKVTSSRQADESVIFTIRDVTAEHQAARTDPITGLANMADFNRHEDLATGEGLTVFFFDALERAAEGREGTEELLRSVVHCLQMMVRDSQDRIWRGEGATLIVLSPPAPGTPVLLEWVEERRRQLADAIAPLTPSRSIVTAGVAVATEPLTAAGALLRAERAMKHGRLGNASSTTHYSAELQDKIDRTWRIEKRLVSALGDSDPAVHGFRVEYQPIVDAESRFANTVEALVRWTHPELGPIFPDEFIPLAEDLDLVDRIDRFVLGVALKDLKVFRSFHPDFKLHVNVSPSGLSPSNLTALTDQLRRSPLANHIMIEITEASLGGHDLPTLAASCARIAETGTTISIDDFGDGESNFHRIGELPVEEVKLAKHFAEVADLIVVESVVASLHSLGNNVVAENIETEAQADKLLRAGVDQFQGYLFARPQPVDDVVEWLLGQTNRPPLPDGSTIGPPCESANEPTHDGCAGWWADAQHGSTTCACPCHARKQSWPGWRSYDLNLTR